MSLITRIGNAFTRLILPVVIISYFAGCKNNSESPVEPSLNPPENAGLFHAGYNRSQECGNKIGSPNPNNTLYSILNGDWKFFYTDTGSNGVDIDDSMVLRFEPDKTFEENNPLRVEIYLLQGNGNSDGRVGSSIPRKAQVISALEDHLSKACKN